MPHAFCRVLAGSLSVILLAAHGAAQPPEPNLRIQAFGGLLGQIEGFCEDPGGSYDWPANPPHPLVACGPFNGSRGSRWLGGVLGARSAVDRSRTFTYDWLIVTGNNHPARVRPTPFWDELAAMGPNVISLGEEDFFRMLQPSVGTAQGMVASVRGSGRLPFVASNVVVRRIAQANDLTSVLQENDGYDLGLEARQSLSWTSSLTLAHPGPASALSATLEEFASRPVPAESGMVTTAPRITAGAGGADSTIAFPEGLRPGRWFRLTIRNGSGIVVMAVFETDEALTPMPALAENVAPTDPRQHFVGFPVRIGDTAEVIAVSLVNPGTRMKVADSVWQWHDGHGDAEVSFLDPKETLATLLKRARRGNAQARPPAVILVSELSDEQTTEVLAAFPEIRFTILHPDSTLLGRGAASGARRVALRPPAAAGDNVEESRFSGDLGLAGIVDAQNAEATKVLVRPEWFGETLATVTARLTTAGPAEWQLTTPAPSVQVIAGAPFNHRLSGSQVTYTAGLFNGTVDIDTVPRYFDCVANDTRPLCTDFRSLWTSPAQLTALIGDAIRRHSRADLAIVSSDLVDDEYMEYLARRIDSLNNNMDWISRYILERLVYRSPRMVKAYVSGADLVSTLQKALKEDGANCISGVGVGCPTALAADHPLRLRVNGRGVNPDLFYAVVVADDLAESLDLDHHDMENVVDLLDVTDQYVHARRWQVDPGGDNNALSFRLERESTRTLESYLAVPTLEVGYTLVEPKDPDGREGVRKNLGLGFSGATASRTIAVNIASDLAYIDKTWFAVRSPGLLRYTRRKEDEDVSYDTDEFSIGIRGDYKRGVLRLFGGYFVDGQLQQHETSLTAEREISGGTVDFKHIEKAKFPTKYKTEPRRYWHQTYGAELVRVKGYQVGPFSLGASTVGVNWSHGAEHNVPVGVTIGGIPQDFNAYTGFGGQKLLNDYFTNPANTFTKTTPFEIVPADKDQNRWQVDVNGNVAYKPRAKEYTAQLQFRFRRYNSPADEVRSDFQLAAERRLEVKLGVPLWWRFKLVPAYVYEYARIEADANNRFSFHRFEANVALPFVIRGGRVWLGK